MSLDVPEISSAARDAAREDAEAKDTLTVGGRGLLMSPSSKFISLKFLTAITAEFMGTFLFAFFGMNAGASNSLPSRNASTSSLTIVGSNFIPFANGFTLAVMGELSPRSVAAPSIMSSSLPHNLHECWQ
jgi:Major intrinsic protein